MVELRVIPLFPKNKTILTVSHSNVRLPGWELGKSGLDAPQIPFANLVGVSLAERGSWKRSDLLDHLQRQCSKNREFSLMGKLGLFALMEKASDLEGYVQSAFDGQAFRLMCNAKATRKAPSRDKRVHLLGCRCYRDDLTLTLAPASASDIHGTHDYFIAVRNV